MISCYEFLGVEGIRLLQLRNDKQVRIIALRQPKLLYEMILYRVECISVNDGYTKPFIVIAEKCILLIDAKSHIMKGLEFCERRAKIAFPGQRRLSRC